MPAVNPSLGDYLPLPWQDYDLTGEVDHLYLEQVETSVGFAGIPQKKQDDWRLLSGKEREFLRSFAARPPAVGRTEREFHHEWWSQRRSLIRKALQVACVPSARIERFDNCGTESFVHYSPSQQRYRVSASYCHDRWCERCARVRANVIASNLLGFTRGRQLLHIVVTWSHEVRPLGDQIRDLKRSYKKLRQTVEWVSRITGSMAFLEIKVAKSDGLWHPHIHVIAEGKFIGMHRLRQLWYRITGKSFMVHVSKVRGEKEARRYVTKYASKPFDPSVFVDEGKLVECIRALHGTRLYECHGKWRKAGMEDQGGDPGDWVSVGRLDTVIADYARGEPYALPIAQALGWEWRRRRPPAKSDRSGDRPPGEAVSGAGG